MIGGAKTTIRERALRIWGLTVMTVFTIGFFYFWYEFFSIPTGRSPVPTCVCPYDNGRPPSRQPTEDDYYSTPPGVNYEPRRR